MATISYKCDSCKRAIELVENTQGFTAVGKCVITNGCIGRLYKVGRNPNNLRESSPSYVEGLNNYIPRRAFFEYNQTLLSNKWTVSHNMGIVPSLSVYTVRADGEMKLLDNSEYTISIIDNNSISIKFLINTRGIVQCIAKSTVPLLPSTVPLDVELQQTSVNGIMTLAVPKFITQLRGTGTSTVSLPIDLCKDPSPIEIEIEVTKPNEPPFVCFETVENFTSNKSPWFGWKEILVRGRRSYCLRTIDLSTLKVFESIGLVSGAIPNGTRIRFLRIDYGSGMKQEIPSRGLMMVLANSPYDYVDKDKDSIIDIGELLGDSSGYFVYQDGEVFISESDIEKTYPSIRNAASMVNRATPAPSATVPIVTPVPTPSPTPMPTPWTPGTIPTVIENSDFTSNMDGWQVLPHGHSFIVSSFDNDPTGGEFGNQSLRWVGTTRDPVYGIVEKVRLLSTTRFIPDANGDYAIKVRARLRNDIANTNTVLRIAIAKCSADGTPYNITDTGSIFLSGANTDSGWMDGIGSGTLLPGDTVDHLRVCIGLMSSHGAIIDIDSVTPILPIFEP